LNDMTNRRVTLEMNSINNSIDMSHNPEKIPSKPRYAYSKENTNSIPNNLIRHGQYDCAPTSITSSSMAIQENRILQGTQYFEKLDDRRILNGSNDITLNQVKHESSESFVASANNGCASSDIRSNSDQFNSRNYEDTKISDCKKAFPRIKHMMRRIASEEDTEQVKSVQETNANKSITTASSMSFKTISSYYPSLTHKRVSPDLSSSVSFNSSPETVPSIAEESLEPENKRQKTEMSDQSLLFEDKLDLLCHAITILQDKDHLHDMSARETMERSKSCSCPRSRCIKLYCECFQEARMCSDLCSCKKCLNTEEETGPHGLRTKAMQNIECRNPYAFKKEKQDMQNPPPIYNGLTCRCVKSQCLKLYCDCFQSGQVCGQFCMCLKCLNTEEESGIKGKRTAARQNCLSRNPDAFKKKVKEAGSGCSCRNSRCLKKYCDCYSNGLKCSLNCTCKDCANLNNDQ